MLVLLIIFMVTAPLMTSGVTVDLPKTNAQPLNSDSEPVTVSIKADGSIFVAEAEVPLADLVPKLQNIAQNNPDRRIFVRGDKDLSYGRIMEVMGTITQGGFNKVALLAEQPAGVAAPAVPPVPAAPAAAAPTAPAAPAVPSPGAGPRRSGR
jgi:biopolymer transport protein TolR